MSRLLLLAASVLGAIAVATPAFAQSSGSTIRIEPRPYYGASVTLEQGVRVWRPLPTTKYVIINPGNKTPLNLGIADYNETHTSNNTHTYNNADVAGGDGGMSGGDFYGGGRLFGTHRFRPDRVHRPRVGGLPAVPVRVPPVSHRPKPVRGHR